MEWLAFSRAEVGQEVLPGPSWYNSRHVNIAEGCHLMLPSDSVLASR